MGIGQDFVLVKSVESEVMWSVAPLSKIQGLLETELIEGTEKVDRLVAFTNAWLLPEDDALVLTSDMAVANC